MRNGPGTSSTSASPLVAKTTVLAIFDCANFTLAELWSAFPLDLVPSLER